MRLAAIDIGSNAIRLQVSEVRNWEKGKIKNLEYIRFPLRLGKDVFNTGEITPPTEERFVKLMIAFKQFLELYEVEDYMVCATSAMREAHNGKQIAKRVYYAHGVRIEIIDGATEGNIITNAITDEVGTDFCLHIDVGGGSTELSVLQDGERLAVHSFRMGSVRKLEAENKTKVFRKIQDWLEKHLPSQPKNLKAVGTGGNIKKLYELAKVSSKKPANYEQLVSISEALRQRTYAERMSEFSLNADRADVIVPASEIYLKVMEMADVKQILVPDVGLKDGVIRTLFNKHATLRGFGNR